MGDMPSMFPAEMWQWLIHPVMVARVYLLNEELKNPRG